MLTGWKLTALGVRVLDKLFVPVHIFRDSLQVCCAVEHTLPGSPVCGLAPRSLVPADCLPACHSRHVSCQCAYSAALACLAATDLAHPPARHTGLHQPADDLRRHPGRAAGEAPGFFGERRHGSRLQGHRVVRACPAVARERVARILHCSWFMTSSAPQHCPCLVVAGERGAARHPVAHHVCPGGPACSSAWPG